MFSNALRFETLARVNSERFVVCDAFPDKISILHFQRSLPSDLFPEGFGSSPHPSKPLHLLLVSWR